MAWRAHGRATVDPNNPRAFGVCDRDGQLYNLQDLFWEMQWRGPRLMRTGFRVCKQCLDVPQEQLRPRILPADPVPVFQPRIEHYYQEDGTQPYVGPGDLVSGATAWYGLRGYTNAYATPSTNPAVLLRRPSDNTTKVVNILANGQFDWPTAWNFCSGGPVYVVTFYDQTGSGLDVTQADPSRQPILLFNALNGRPVILMTGGQWLIGSAVPPAMTNATLMTVVCGMNETMLFQNIIGGSQVNNPSDLVLVFAPADTDPNSINFGSTGGFDAPASPNVWHSAIGVSHTIGNATLAIDGVITTGDNEPPIMDSPLAIGWGANTPGSPPFLNAQFAEGGLWPSAFSANQISAMYSNQQEFWGLSVPWGPSPPP